MEQRGWESGDEGWRGYRDPGISEGRAVRKREVTLPRELAEHRGSGCYEERGRRLKRLWGEHVGHHF